MHTLYGTVSYMGSSRASVPAPTWLTVCGTLPRGNYADAASSFTSAGHRQTASWGGSEKRRYIEKSKNDKSSKDVLGKPSRWTSTTFGATSAINTTEKYPKCKITPTNSNEKGLSSLALAIAERRVYEA